MAQMDLLSDRISTQIRWFAAGVIALIWGLLTTPPGSIRVPFHPLVVVGLLAVSVLFCDFLQYTAGYLSTRRLHRKLLDSPDQVIDGYDPRDLYRNIRFALFWIKQALAIVTFAVLAITLLRGLVTL
jgi:hypothetical protein